jgi:hypothetical protein
MAELPVGPASPCGTLVAADEVPNRPGVAVRDVGRGRAASGGPVTRPVGVVAELPVGLASPSGTLVAADELPVDPASPCGTLVVAELPVVVP